MPDTVTFPPRITGPGQVLWPPETGYPIFKESRKYLAQGDSWFSMAAFPPFTTTNILMEMRFNETACIVNCARPGAELLHMINWKYDPQFVALLVGKMAYTWDAIFLSGGGNDVIDAANTLPMRPNGEPVHHSERLLLGPGERPPTGSVLRYVSNEGWNTFVVHLSAQFSDIMMLLASAESQNRSTPVFLQLYDYPVVRNAPASIFPIRIGPWLYKAFTAYDIPDSDWDALVTELINRLASLLKGFATQYPNVHVVNTLGTLTRAAAGTTGVSGDWENEIHPTSHGFALIAQKYVAAVEEVV